MLVVGPNGAGKTNLLESLHVGSQGFSPRTRTEAQLIRFGASAARVTLEGVRGESKATLAVTLSTSDAKRATLNGARLPAAEQLRREVLVHAAGDCPNRRAFVNFRPDRQESL